jgi:hypothetical protein
MAKMVRVQVYGLRLVKVEIRLQVQQTELLGQVRVLLFLLLVDMVLPMAKIVWAIVYG